MSGRTKSRAQRIDSRVTKEYRAILGLNDDPKTLTPDNTELISDSVARSGPSAGPFIAQEIDHRNAELVERLEVQIVGDVLMHQPHSRSMGSRWGEKIGRKRSTLAFGLASHSLDDDGAMMGGVVEKDMDAAHLGMRALDLLKKLEQTRPIDPLDVQDLSPAGLQIDGAVEVQPIPARGLLHGDGDALRSPASDWPGLWVGWTASTASSVSIVLSRLS